jgi:hypothetical protein
MGSETWTCCDCGSVMEAQDPAACSSCVLEVIDEAALKEAALGGQLDAAEADRDRYLAERDQARDEQLGLLRELGTLRAWVGELEAALRRIRDVATWETADEIARAALASREGGR